MHISTFKIVKDYKFCNVSLGCTTRLTLQPGNINIMFASYPFMELKKYNVIRLEKNDCDINCISCNIYLLYIIQIDSRINYYQKSLSNI